MTSIIVAPVGNDTNLSLCLDSIRHQWQFDLEVLVALDDNQKSLRKQVTELNDPRFRCIDVSRTTSVWERFNIAARVGLGEFVKFIGGTHLAILYPYALRSECALLVKVSDRDFLIAGALLGSSFGPVSLSPREVLSLDLASGGTILRTDTACCLFRREAFLAAHGFDSTLASWAATDLCCRLAIVSGAIVGPYGMCTTCKLEPNPTGSLPETILEKINQQCKVSWGSADKQTWVEVLAAEATAVRRRVEDEAQWHSSRWLPRFLTEEYDVMKAPASAMVSAASML